MTNFVLRHTKISFLLYMLTTAVASFIIQSAMATIHYPTNGRFVLVTDLEKINDNYLKYVLTLDNWDYSRNGIIHMNVIDFLKDENI